MRVFVLGTGRCGTTTFAQACTHLSNYTAGHETRIDHIGESRFSYPDDHIEADNRLAWFLGSLAERFDRTDVFYVHLRRNPEDVVRSLRGRWKGNVSIMRAFGYDITSGSANVADPDAIARFYINTVTANIEEFLRDRQSMTVWLEEVHHTFPQFLDHISAEGDIDAAIREWSVAHHAQQNRRKARLALHRLRRLQPKG